MMHLLALVWLLCRMGFTVAQSQTLTIYHTNDLQGQLLPGPSYDELLGGFRRLCQALKGAAADRAALVVDGGDALGSDPLSRWDGGKPAWELMGAVGYTAVVAGDHEFDYGLDTLKVRLEGGPAIVGINIGVQGLAVVP
ncbi:MAG: hypothetical protein FJY95_00210 [Candidatus Handelsmanbacteria bacterium]|nr:hypothetical protein [Candidatus Handelsmanbacteria bacterium]